MELTTERIIEAVKRATSKQKACKLLGWPGNGRYAKKLEIIALDRGISLNCFKMGQPKKYFDIEKICPVCNKVFITQKGHPKEKNCCSHQCANSFNARPKTADDKDKISFGVGKYLGKIYKNVPKDIDGNRLHHEHICLNCKKIFLARKQSRKFCSRVCSGRWAGNDPKYKEMHRQIMLKRVKDGLHVGWKTRSSQIPSYPEIFFMDVLDSRNIHYDFNLLVGKWFIDFAIKDKMIALEIDGKQHEKPERKSKDIEKDAYLVSQGWRVYRIKWKSINNDKGKIYIKNEIDKFLELFRSVA